MGEKVPSIGSVLLCFFELLVGIVLLIQPEKFTSAIIIVMGIGIMVLGVISAVKYFRLNAEDAAMGQHLLKSLVFLLGGAFCVFNSQWFIEMFPVVTIVYGVIMLLCGLEKIQLTVDMIRMKKRKWYFEAISAAVSIVCSIIILCNLFDVKVALWIFTGIALIVEAALDIVVLIVVMIDNKERPTVEITDHQPATQLVKNEDK